MCPEELKKIESYLANERSGLAFFSMTLGQNFVNIVGNQIGVMLRGKGPPKPDFTYDIVRTLSLSLYLFLCLS